jgi:hydrogenase maturation protease
MEPVGEEVVTEDSVRAALNDVIVPQVERSIVDLNLVRGVNIAEEKVTVTVASTALDQVSRDFVTVGVIGALKKRQVAKVGVEFVEAKPPEVNQVGSIIAVMSGKGGVGKSVVTSLLAIALKRQGHSVGIIDADITGSSIPRMFGVSTRPLGSESGILPVATQSGISVMSMNLLLPEEATAVIWRAPLLSRAIGQFWTDVLWGKLDYLLIDLPPGTADAPLTVMQSIPVTGIIIVSTPQGLVEMIVKKALDMARKMNQAVLGVVENMSYFYVPELDRKYELFGPSKADDMARAAGAPLLARLAIDPELARLCDDGEIEEYRQPVVEELGKATVLAIGAKSGTKKP